MSYHKSGSDLDVCAHCERLLAPNEDVLCGPCARQVIDTWEEPSDEQKLRARELTSRFWAGDWSVIGLIALLVLIAGTWAHDAQAQSSRAHENVISRTIAGQTHAWDAPEPGCVILRAWEDHSVVIQCPSGLFTYDPDGSADRGIGWYAVDNTR